MDNETKAAPTTSSSDGTSGLPPRFPKRLACLEINLPAFEQGFDEQFVQGVIPSHMQCAICQGLPRRPATLDGCGHLFFERCIKQHFEIRAEAQTPWRTVKAAPCPSCMQKFRVGEILTWPAWQWWSQLAYNVHIVRCQHGCPFIGTPAPTNDNQARVCPLRVIACPVDGCQARRPAVEIEHQHFTHCPLMRIHCPTCNLPVRVKKLATHDCVKDLKSALMCMLSPGTS